MNSEPLNEKNWSFEDPSWTKKNEGMSLGWTMGSDPGNESARLSKSIGANAEGGWTTRHKGENFHHFDPDVTNPGEKRRELWSYHQTQRPPPRPAKGL